MLKHLFTGIDNTTYDLGRVLWFKMAAAFVLLSAWHMWHGGAFDPLTWSAGAAGVMTGGAGATRIKASTEPAA